MVSFDINLADTAKLKQIRGVGNVLSARIIKYRNKIGGFVSTKQVSEVYGLKPEVLQRLEESTFVTNGYVPSKINVNEAGEKLLASHPYISYKLASAIVAYRMQHGVFKSLDELQKIHILDGETLNKIAPYLEL